MSDYRAYDRYREDSPGSRRDYSPSRRSDYSPRRSKSTRTYPRERGAPDYVEETTYVERGKGPPPRDLIPRREDSVEDIPREFPPPSRSVRGFRDDYDDRRSTRRSRSEYGGRRDSYDDEYDEYAAGAAGAAGAAAGGRSRRGTRGGRRGGRRDDDYYSEDEDYERYERKGGSRSGSRSGRRKSGIEGMLEGLGLGGIAGAAAKQFGGRSRSRSRARSKARSRAGSESRSRSRSRSGRKQRQWAQAAQAAIVAGAVEAFRARKDPGPWGGDKGRRIATAAIGAGGIDRLVDRDPDHKSKRHLAEAVIGGLAANRLANGPRNRSESRGRARSESRGGGLRSRSRSIIDRFRSKSRGRSASREGSQEPPARSKSRGIKDLAAGGALAAAGKAIYDRVRSKSRKRDASRSSSEDSYVPSRRRARSRSVGPQSQRARSLGPDDGAVVGPRGRATDRGDDYDDDPSNPLRGTRTGEGAKSRDSSKSSSSSDTDLENRRKKLRGKELLTAGLASIATIHAGHGVYQSMKASENRHKLVQEGEMSPEEARKKRSKAWLQDAAAVGIAALGIKGAYSEWREMNEQRHSVKELEERRAARAKRRAKRERELGVPGGNRRAPQGRLPPPQSRPDDPYVSGALPPPPLGASNGGGR